MASLLADSMKPQVLSTATKIAEGCSNGCAFCVIPKLRGRYRSRSMEALLKEARGLADSGEAARHQQLFQLPPVLQLRQLQNAVDGLALGGLNRCSLAH